MRGRAQTRSREWRRRRAASAGFTLIELMVVVVMVALLALLAGPALSRSRDDRWAFAQANAIGQLFHEARMRATARGAAQLVAITSNGAADRGTFLLFESVRTVDAPPPPALPVTERPVSSCKLHDEWTGVPAGSATNRLVRGINLNGGADSIQQMMGILTEVNVTAAGQNAAFVCFTPSGRVYAATTVAALETAQPFTGNMVVGVLRKPGTAQIGLKRNVIVTASGATRIRSE